MRAWGQPGTGTHRSVSRSLLSGSHVSGSHSLGVGALAAPPPPAQFTVEAGCRAGGQGSLGTSARDANLTLPDVSAPGPRPPGLIYC